MNHNRKTIAIVGLGRVGLTLGRLLCDNDWQITALCGRDLQQTVMNETLVEACQFIGVDPLDCRSDNFIKADIVLITVPDDAIASVVSDLVRQKLLSNNSVLIHCSGMHPASVMHIEGMSNPCASLHPLQSIASPEMGIELLPESLFTVEGDTEGVTVATELCRSIGAEVRPLSSNDKVLYHAAAVMASNCLTALCASAIDLFEQCDFSEEDARAMLLPLIQGSVDNLKKLPAHRALTGPVSRGDITTVKQQLKQLDELNRSKEGGISPAAIYRLLGSGCADLAEKDNRLTKADSVILRKILK